MSQQEELKAKGEVELERAKKILEEEAQPVKIIPAERKVLLFLHEMISGAYKVKLYDQKTRKWIMTSTGKPIKKMSGTSILQKPVEGDTLNTIRNIVSDFNAQNAYIRATLIFDGKKLVGVSANKISEINRVEKTLIEQIEMMPMLDLYEKTIPVEQVIASDFNEARKKTKLMESNLNCFFFDQGLKLDVKLKGTQQGVAIDSVVVELDL